MAIVAAKILKSGEAEGFRPSWKAICEKYDSELPKGTKPDTLRNRVNRTRQAQKDADAK